MVMDSTEVQVPEYQGVGIKLGLGFSLGIMLACRFLRIGEQNLGLG